MWYPASVTVAPAAEPVSLTEAMVHLKIDAPASGPHPDQGLIETQIEAARVFAEAHCAARFVTQTVAMKCDAWTDLARLPEAPVQSVTSISYVDTAGAAQTLAGASYELRADGLDAGIVPAYGVTWPVIRPGSRITVTAVVGTVQTPAPVKQAMLLHIGMAYERREGTHDFATIYALLANWRRGA